MIIGDRCHNNLIENIKPELAYSDNVNYYEWKNQVQKKYKQLLGLSEIEKNQVEIKIKIEYQQDKGYYNEIRFTFESEKDCTVPCYLLIPNINKEKYPVLICLQGHSTGFHNSIGKAIYDGDEQYIKTRGDFGIQAVKNGYAALCIEQRGMGERKTTVANEMPERGCDFTSYTVLLLGRTIIGERVWDISKAIDTLKFFKQIDTDKIGCVGNSGGGTATYYAACFDERIKIAVPSCAVCSYKESIAKLFHCSCNYIPGAYKYFDMGELACLIAPRNLIIIAGKKDDIFLFNGVKQVYNIINKIYKNHNSSDNCKLVISPKGHYWDKDLIWDSVNKTVSQVLKW